MSLHTATFKGKRVRIILRDGTIIVDRFIERTSSKWVVLETRRIHVRDIRAFAPYRKLEAA